MAIPSNARVYCDANFFVAYRTKKADQSDVQKNAQVLFAELLVNNCTIVASPLSFDEAWNGIRREVGPKPTKKKRRLKDRFENILRMIGIRFVQPATSEFSFNEVMPILKEFTNKLVSSSKFQVIQFPSSVEKQGVVEALNNVEKFGMKPRDSFHLSLMQTNNIRYLVTRDGDFTKKKWEDIEIITF